MSAYQQLGGEPFLRPLIERFVGRMYVDPMIGFFFAQVRQERIVTLEMQHAAEHLGHTEPYRGRPLRQAHAKHAIGGGHFARRLQILREVLREARVPAAIIDAWLAAQQRARPDIVRRGPSAPCPQ